MNTPPSGTFQGKNFMTPTILGYYKLTKGWAEFSSGRGINDDPIFGVTVRHAGGARMEPDPSRLCYSRYLAITLIRELGGEV